jgi:diadenosine tetraphosphate (Ap4A) HIT family hydrolase
VITQQVHLHLYPQWRNRDISPVVYEIMQQQPDQQ